MRPSARTPRLIPVLDVMGGVVVRAVGGRRDEYRPIESKLTRSCDPLDVAAALAGATGSRELYAADLDSITGRGNSLPILRRIVEKLGIEVWTDFGYRTYDDAAKIPNEWVPGVNPVIGSETVRGPGELALAAVHFMPFIAFSIDLRNGRPVYDVTDWSCALGDESDPVTGLAAAAGTPFLMLIDLARVGEAGGPGTELLCRAIKDRRPDVELIAGGGVRSWDDVDRLGEAGADGVLVSSALHDGSLKVPRG